MSTYVTFSSQFSCLVCTLCPPQYYRFVLHLQIRVNSVNPTVVLTDMGRKNWSDPEKSTPMIARIPQHKFAGIWCC